MWAVGSQLSHDMNQQGSSLVSPIPLVVVESHQHALEHVHTILRRHIFKHRTKLPKHDDLEVTTGGRSNCNDGNAKGGTVLWTMIHFDSHPDLACLNSSIPAKLCFTPNVMMERVSNHQCHDHHNSDAKAAQNCTTECASTESTLISANTSTNTTFNGVSNVTSKVSSDDALNRSETTTISNSTEENESNNKEQTLYEMLDLSQGGIAEWITPLVLAGGLSKIYWVKNSWCEQFDLGEYNYSIGSWIPPNYPTSSPSTQQRIVSDRPQSHLDLDTISSFIDLPLSAIVKTSLYHPYYLDDNSFVPSDQLVLEQQLKLIVAEFNMIDNDDCKDVAKPSDLVPKHTYTSTQIMNYEKKPTTTTPWMLDICLDYFHCSNPFLDELYDLDPDLALTLWKIVNETTFRKNALNAKSINLPNVSDNTFSQYRQEQEQFLHLVKAYFQRLLSWSRSINDMSNDPCSQVDSSVAPNEEDFALPPLLSVQDYNTLYQFYSSKSHGQVLWGSLSNAIDRIIASEMMGMDEKKCNTTFCGVIERLVQVILNAIPNLSLPFTTSLDESQSSDKDACLHLPDFVIKQVKEISHSLRNGQFSFSSNSFTASTPPFLITICRSTEDGYTPSFLVEQLQCTLLDELHKVYCGCDNFDPLNPTPIDDGTSRCECKLNILFDYGEFEGSTFY